MSGAFLASHPTRARLLITIEEGLVSTVAVEGLPPGVEIEVVKIDFDTEGSEEADGVLSFDGGPGFVSVGTVESMTDDESRLARCARDTWALSE